jgi:hypothetical protein
LEVDLTLYDALGKQTTQILPLGPRQTARYSIRQFIKSGGLTGEYGGIHIQALTHGGSLDTLHAIYDEDAGFSALLKMFDRDPKAKIEERDFNHSSTWTLRAPMLALANPDPALNFPAGTVLHPQIFVRNASARRVVTTIRFNWRKQDETGTAKGPTLALAPFETKRVDISQLQGGATLPKDANWAAVTLTTNSLPDEVLAVAASFDSTLRYGAQTLFSDQLSSIWKGGQFEYDSMHNSLIVAGNGGSKPIQSAFTIFYNQGQQKYELEQKLEPDQQVWIDIGKLVRNQVPDKTGKTLPLDLATGSYEFRDLTNRAVGNLYEGKIIYDKSYGHVAYGCAACCAIRSLYLFYDPFYNPVGPGYTNGVDGRDDCGDNAQDISDSFYNWSTANHTIATTTIYGTHTGVSVGATTSSTNGYVVHTNGRNGCYEVPEAISGPTDVVNVSQSPSTISMSNGDTNYAVTVSVTPFSYASSTGLSYGLSSNPNSSSNASLSFTAPTNFTGNDAWKVNVSGSNSPSGIFSDIACSVGVCSSQSTTITVPPQLLIQMFYGEANTYSAGTMEALGSSVLNRCGSAHAYFASFTAWQNALICSQYNGICAASGITTGVQPELTAAVPVFNTSVGDIVGGSACFFSPTPAGWTTIQQMLDSGTTTLTPVPYDPGCFSASTRQYVYKDSIDDTAGGTPTFVFVRQRAATSPAVVDIP